MLFTRHEGKPQEGRLMATLLPMAEAIGALLKARKEVIESITNRGEFGW